MLPRFNIHTKRAAFLLVLLMAIPIAVLGAPSEEELTEARDEFNQLWHAAAETTQRRATLEESLSTFDSRVASARKDLEKAAEQRKDARERIAGHRKFVEALQGQIRAADEAQAFYHAVALSQKDDFIRFLQYMASKDIALHESGPAVGGDLLKHVLRGSLGDSVEDALARDAVIQTRTRFLGQVRVLVNESTRVQDRLKDVAMELDEEMKLIESENKTLASIMDEKSDFIDETWKQKQLTEEELKFVAQESAEANGRIAALQESLVSINEQLKNAKQSGLQEELQTLQARQAAIASERSSFIQVDNLHLAEGVALKAYQEAMSLKNTDKKLYKRIEEQQLQTSLKQESLTALEKEASGSGSTSLRYQIAKLQAEIAFIDQVLTYMKDGVPQEPAEKYVAARRQADEAERKSAEIEKKMSKYDPELKKLGEDVALKLQEIRDIEQQFSLGGLPPIFLWPVKGPISAGYLDPDYAIVFNVPHRGMDIAVAQATPVRSVADGVVFAAKDGGLTGYSYVLIGHRNGYASLYGHVSSMFVKAGDKVNAGQMVALSGGRPGTHGAGYMTTGSHLHLEITKDGAHINPMSVLLGK